MADRWLMVVQLMTAKNWTGPWEWHPGSSSRLDKWQRSYRRADGMLRIRTVHVNTYGEVVWRKESGQFYIWDDLLGLRRADGMCPHCGDDVSIKNGLTVSHSWPKPTRQLCPGTGQYPRCAESDARPLWNGKPNRRFCG